jgi:hypothetical protein
MAPEIALLAIPAFADRPVTVLDPMCGSGTVLSAAASRGQNAIGVDIDPLAVLMSRVATSPIDGESLRAATDEVTRAARELEGAQPWIDDETERFVDYWFAPTQKAQLTSLTTAISSREDGAIRDALQVALSRLIVTKTPQASLAADTSHSRPHRVQETSDYDVLAGFKRSVNSLERLLGQRIMTGTANVARGDSRELEGIATDSVDLIVTSPPYLNALDYMRGHKMALVWFGWSVAELRALRGRSIGAERAPDADVSAKTSELVDLIREQATEPSALPVRTIERFAGDMQGFAYASHRVIRQGGKAVFVVGNSTLRGNYIRNDVIVQQAMESAGFREINRYEREIPANRRYMAINTRQESTLGKRMRTEVVLTMEAS